LLREIAAGGLERDLVVYFYERFLERYDAGERKRRGVYYTPPELVGYLIRAVQTVLVQEFELPDGLADDHVIVLDPAVGTGTFVLGAAEQALDTVSERGTASQRRLIREHLLADFYGFELLPAPYTVAHLKLSSFFDSRGYQLSEGERVRVYLTNSMEPFESDEGGQLSFLPMIRGIVEEGRAAGYVKERVPVLVVLGNPPYERTSHNENDHSNNLLEDFYWIDGQRLSEKNTGPLRDDYLRFIRWSIWKLLEQPGAIGHGVLALVTNRAYLERTLHRAVRRFLLRSFDAIHVFDLHGDQREWFADRVDEKVFKEVQAGIALTVFVKHPSTENSDGGMAKVRYREVFGRRGEKLDACRAARIDDDAWVDLSPRHPLWLFVPYEVPPEYDTWPRATDLFPVNVVGFQTHRDQLVVAATQEELRARLVDFANLEIPDEVWERQGVKTNADWSLEAAREQLAAERPRRLVKVTYRGLERRWMAVDERLVDRIRTKVSPYLLERDDNLALVFANGSLSDGPYTIASRTPVPAVALSWRTFGTAYFAPLWIRDSTTGDWIANVPRKVLKGLDERGIEANAQALFHYVYAVLNARTYRTRFAHALRYEFPRIPISANPVTQVGPPLDGDDQAVLSAPTYDEQTSTIHLAPRRLRIGRGRTSSSVSSRTALRRNGIDCGIPSSATGSVKSASGSRRRARKSP
jgi:predicted helicase